MTVKPGKKLDTLTIRIPPAVKRTLAAMATEAGRRRSSFTRDIILKHLETVRNEQLSDQ